MDLFASVCHGPSAAAVVLGQLSLVGVMLCLPVLVAVASADAAVFANGSLGTLALLMVKEVDPATHLSSVGCRLALPLPFADDARRYTCRRLARLGGIRLDGWVVG